jgi:hypothetical protein
MLATSESCARSVAHSKVFALPTLMAIANLVILTASGAALSICEPVRLAPVVRLLATAFALLACVGQPLAVLLPLRSRRRRNVGIQ